MPPYYCQVEVEAQVLHLTNTDTQRKALVIVEWGWKLPFLLDLYFLVGRYCGASLMFQSWSTLPLIVERMRLFPLGR